MEGRISFWGYKEQESNLILPEHDDDDDDDELKSLLTMEECECKANPFPFVNDTFFKNTRNLIPWNDEWNTLSSLVQQFYRGPGRISVEVSKSYTVTYKNKTHTR